MTRTASHRCPAPALLWAAVLAMLSACSGGGASPTPVPRPKAWPRVETAAPCWRPDSLMPMAMEVNAEARVEPGDSSAWFNITYPRYPGAVVYVTFASAATPGELDAIIANRLERMALNAGSATSELTELTSASGLACRLLSTPRGTVTPLQFLAVDPGSRRVMTGAFFHPDAAARPDSLAPVTAAVGADLLHMLQTLRP